MGENQNHEFLIKLKTFMYASYTKTWTFSMNFKNTNETCNSGKIFLKR